MAEPKINERMEKIVSLCKRRAFVYPASEIYGGLNGFWDYGPLGVLLKNNIRDWWWRHMVECPPSGHVGGFSDPMVDDRETKQRYRADHVKVFVPIDGKGHAYAFLEGEQETAE